MSLIGFKRMIITPYDKATGKPGDTSYKIEGKEGEGATVSAEINGLSSEPVKVYGSNIAYYVLQKGTGDVTIDFGILDMLTELNDTILGYKKGTVANADFTFIGEDTEPPYCTVVLESETLQGEKAMLGFFKGKFSKETVSLNTKEEGNPEPEADTYTFSALSSDRDDETKGQVVVKYLGSTKVEEFKQLVTPTPAI